MGKLFRSTENPAIGLLAAETKVAFFITRQQGPISVILNFLVTLFKYLKSAVN